MFEVVEWLLWGGEVDLGEALWGGRGVVWAGDFFSRGLVGIRGSHFGIGVIVSQLYSFSGIWLVGWLVG